MSKQDLKILMIPEAAKFLGVSESKVRSNAEKLGGRRLNPAKVRGRGSAWYFFLADLERNAHKVKRKNKGHRQITPSERAQIKAIVLGVLHEKGLVR